MKQGFLLRGVRAECCKLIHFFEQPEELELYDLSNDPDERRNLANDRKYAAQLKTLKDRMAELRREVGDTDPPGPAPIAVSCKGRMP